MAVTRTTNVHGAAGTLGYFSHEEVGRCFATFDYGPSEDRTTVFLTPEQTEQLAKDAAVAVADFRAHGALPALTTVSGIEDTEIPANLIRPVLEAAADDDRPF